MPTQVTCDHCAGVIGVYEPLVLVRDDEIRESSRASDPKRFDEATARYHRDCYRERFRFTRV